MLVEAGLADANQVDYDVGRGLLWIGTERVAEWAGDDALEGASCIKVACTRQVLLLKPRC